jgi:3,4-dihydroxy 2-butanone 4-phosphate synthase/GTP cyclohydrolase II
MEGIKLSNFNDVLTAYAKGEAIILVDHAKRENEGDLTVATEKITREMLAFMTNECRGLTCVSLEQPLAKRLGLSLQTTNNQSPYHTQFTVSVNYLGKDNTEKGDGFTASERALCMRKLIDEDSQASDFVRPGGVFPLIADRRGVLGRGGQTEGSLDLARLAALKPSGVICEILDENGKLLRGAQLEEFAKKHGFLITSVAEIIRYRIQNEILVKEVARATLMTDHGEFEGVVFEDQAELKEHLLLYKDCINDSAPVAVRIHSECLTGDVFGSRRCDCGEQLNKALEYTAKHGGIILYLQQEGRGIGLANKLRAYALQDQGHDTVEANLKLGFAADERDFAVAAKMLRAVGVEEVRLLTNNPDKLNALENYGIKIHERIPLIAADDEFSRSYIETKRTKLGHLI